MSISTRPALAAGVAAVGVGAIALAPMQATPDQLELASHRAVNTIAVELAASVDPIQLWKETLQTSWTNASGLAADFMAKPFPIATSIFTNQITYLKELPDFGRIGQQIAANARTLFTLPLQANLDTLDSSHRLVWNAVNVIPLAPALQTLLDLTTAYTSGQVIGFVGPGVATTIQLVDSVKATFGAPDVQTALNEVVNLPANLTNAFLNGGKTLKLTGMLPQILPPEIASVGITFGGFLSRGGSMFNSLDLTAPGVKVPGHGAGAFGSTIDLNKQLGATIAVSPPTAGAAAATKAGTPAPALKSPRAVRRATAGHRKPAAGTPAQAGSDAPAKPAGTPGTD